MTTTEAIAEMRAEAIRLRNRIQQLREAADALRQELDGVEAEIARRALQPKDETDAT